MMKGLEHCQRLDVIYLRSAVYLISVMILLRRSYPGHYSCGGCNLIGHLGVFEKSRTEWLEENSSIS